MPREKFIFTWKTLLNAEKCKGKEEYLCIFSTVRIKLQVSVISFQFD